MKKWNILVLVISVVWGTISAYGQSAVYVYKNPHKGEGNYICMRGVSTQKEAEMLSKQKLEELVSNDSLIYQYASTNKKGYGIILKAEVKVNGKTMTIYGAALGCKSYKEAEKKALENLREKNPEWKGEETKVVYKFKD